MKYILLLLFLLGCKPNDKKSSYLTTQSKYKQDIQIYTNGDTFSNISIKNWHGNLPDCVYLKPVFSISISDSSNIIAKDGFLRKIKHIGIEQSRLNSDTLFINKTFGDLDYLFLTNLNCVITNDDSISIKNLNYGLNQKGKYSFALDLNLIKDLDTLYIYAPYENIVIPLDKNYKHITLCTLNDQGDTLRKYYKYVDVLSYCK